MSTGLSRVLGIDPGTAIMGYGVVEQDGSHLRALAYGAIITTNADPLPRRLSILHEQLGALISTYQPMAVAVESLFFNRNVRTALAVGQARGVALLASAQANLQVYEYTPQQVKDAVVGYGRASKEQVQAMIRILVGLDEAPRPDDAADAVAIAICHLHSARLNALASGQMAP